MRMEGRKWAEKEGGFIRRLDARQGFAFACPREAAMRRPLAVVRVPCARIGLRHYALFSTFFRSPSLARSQ